MQRLGFASTDAGSYVQLALESKHCNEVSIGVNGFSRSAVVGVGTGMAMEKIIYN